MMKKVCFCFLLLMSACSSVPEKSKKLYCNGQITEDLIIFMGCVDFDQHEAYNSY